MYTRVLGREGVVNTPVGHRSKLLLVTVSSLTQREQTSGILIEPVYSLKLGIFWVPRSLKMRHVGGLF